MTGCLGFGRTKPAPVPPVLLEGTLSGPSPVVGKAQNPVVSSDHRGNFSAVLASLFKGRTAFAAPAVISGETPLANVAVMVYTLAEYVQDPGNATVVEQGTTDADGAFALTGVPEGVDLIVVADTTPRLSAIVPARGKVLTANVNSATALVAETWASALQNGATTVSASDLAAAVDEARQGLDALQLDAAGLSNALADLIPDTFGEGLSDTPPPALEPLVDALNRSAPGYVDTTYRAAGWVEDQTGARLPGIEVTFSGGHASVHTDAQGEWQRDGLEGDVTVSAQDVNGSFTVITPPRTVSEETVNVAILGYAGTLNETYRAAGPYNVSGYVTLADGTPVEGVKMEARFASEVARTNGQGEFNFADLEVLTVLAPELDGHIFNPAQRTIGRETQDVHFTAQPVAAGIVFADPVVHAAVEDALNVPAGDPITAEAALGLNTLSLRDGGVSSLAGVEHLLNLEVLLVFGDNPGLSDLTPLADLQQLQEVEISNSSVVDIAPLANKPSLRKVHLNKSHVAAVSALGTLVNLNDLSVQDSPVTDATPLEGLANLEQLALRGLDITALPSFANMPALDSLLLDDNRHLTNIDTLRDTTATWIVLNDTPALDWCSWDETWSIVDALRDAGAHVDTNALCEGPYTLFGRVRTVPGIPVPYNPTAEVVLENSSGDSWVATTDADGYWEQTVEGTVTLRPRVRDEESVVWRFDPGVRQHIRRPQDGLNFLVARSGDPIIEGYITDDAGESLGVEQVKFIAESGGGEIVVDVDAEGYFAHRLPAHGSYNVVPVADGEWTASMPMPVSTPVRVNFTRHDAALEPLDVYLFSATRFEPDAIVGEDIRLAAEVTDYSWEEVDFTWSVQAGTLGEENFNWVEWTVPGEPGTVTVSVHVTSHDGRTGTDELQINVWEPPAIAIEADRYVVQTGERVALTATVTGYRNDRARISWLADHGVLEYPQAADTDWVAPNYGGTFAVSVAARVDGIASERVVVEIEVMPDPLCEGAENCSVIRTLDDLQAMQDNMTARYILANNIDATPTQGETRGFEPIGTEEAPFVGIFEGRDHVIDGLYVGPRAASGVGLFGVAEGAIISDVGLTNAIVEAGSATNRPSAGILLGHGTGVVVDNVYSTGQVTLSLALRGGGLVGRMTDGGIIQNSYSTADVTSELGSGPIGGLVGLLERNSTVQDSYATGDVTGNSNVAGLVASIGAGGGTVERSWSSGTVTGQGGTVGGLVGYINTGIGPGIGPGVIIDSYSTGDVSGQGDDVGGLVGQVIGGHIIASSSEGNVFGGGRHVGGLVGYVWSEESLIENSHSSGDVEGADEYVGGLVGANGGFVSVLAQDLRGGTIRDSSSSGDVFGQRYVGGLVGRHTRGGVIEGSWASGRVEGVKSLVGGLVGASAWGPAIYDSYSTGEVHGDSDVGGLIGINRGRIDRSHSYGDVFGASSYVGGFASQNQGDISYSSAQNDVSGGGDYIGGFAGRNTTDGGQFQVGTIHHSFSLGNVTGVDYVGGLIGEELKPSGTVGPRKDWVTHSYAIGTVVGRENVGGLLGYQGDISSVKWSYFVGTVSGEDYVGLLIGRQESLREDTTEGSYAGAGPGMKDPNTYVGWDFINTWRIDNDYPDLIENPR